MNQPLARILVVIHLFVVAACGVQSTAAVVSEEISSHPLKHFPFSASCLNSRGDSSTDARGLSFEFSNAPVMHSENPELWNGQQIMTTIQVHKDLFDKEPGFPSALYIQLTTTALSPAQMRGRLVLWQKESGLKTTLRDSMILNHRVPTSLISLWESIPTSGYDRTRPYRILFENLDVPDTDPNHWHSLFHIENEDTFLVTPGARNKDLDTCTYLTKVGTDGVVYQKFPKGSFDFPDVGFERERVLNFKLNAEFFVRSTFSFQAYLFQNQKWELTDRIVHSVSTREHTSTAPTSLSFVTNLPGDVEVNAYLVKEGGGEFVTKFPVKVLPEQTGTFKNYKFQFEDFTKLFPEAKQDAQGNTTYLWTGSRFITARVGDRYFILSEFNLAESDAGRGGGKQGVSFPL